MIKVKSKGAKLCESYEKPAVSELNNFYNHYVSPNTPFSISVAQNGDLRIGEKSEGKPTGGITTTGKKLLTPMFQPVSTTFKCRISATQDDISKVNRWITELGGNE